MWPSADRAQQALMGYYQLATTPTAACVPLGLVQGVSLRRCVCVAIRIQAPRSDPIIQLQSPAPLRIKCQCPTPIVMCVALARNPTRITLLVSYVHPARLLASLASVFCALLINCARVHHPGLTPVLLGQGVQMV